MTLSWTNQTFGFVGWEDFHKVKFLCATLCIFSGLKDWGLRRLKERKVWWKDLNEHRQLGNPASLGLGLTITWLPVVAEKLRERASPDYLIGHIHFSSPTIPTLTSCKKSRPSSHFCTLGWVKLVKNSPCRLSPLSHMCIIFRLKKTKVCIFFP